MNPPTAADLRNSVEIIALPDDPADSLTFREEDVFTSMPPWAANRAIDMSIGRAIDGAPCTHSHEEISAMPILAVWRGKRMYPRN